MSLKSTLQRVTQKKYLSRLAALAGMLIFGVALLVLFHELRAYNYHDVITHLRSLPASRISWAILLMLLNYLVLTGYDTLAFRYIHHPLPYHKIAMTSFIGYAFSHNIGFTILTNGSVRYRFYSSWGLSALDVTKVVIFCGLTFWLGFFVLGGAAFAFKPLLIPAAVPLPASLLRWLGILFLGLVALYLILSLGRFRILKIRNWEFAMPSPAISLGQITLATADWVLGSSILYALLPPGSALTYPAFLSIYLLAQIAGLVSQVPGGLGVFETVILLLLEPFFSPSSVLGMLLAFRGIYYFIPLFMALILLGTHELLVRRERIKRAAQLFGKWAPVLVPNVLALTTFVSGALVLFTGAAPMVSWRLSWMQHFLPLPLLEFSHFSNSLIGVALLFLAQGLLRRLDAAYIGSAVLLGAGIVFSLVRGLDYETALILAIMLAALLPARAHFYRKSSFLQQRLTFGWMVAVALVLGSSLWLGFFSYKHVHYSHALWWKFTVAGDASRFLRASVGALSALVFFTLLRLLRPSPPDSKTVTSEDTRCVREIVAQAPRSYARLAFLGDKTFLLSQNRQAFIMYSVVGQSWITMSDPVGPKQEMAEIIWRFRELCERHDAWPVFYQVGSSQLQLYLDLGLALLKLGEEARVPLNRFSLAAAEYHDLRRTCHRLEREPLEFEVLPAKKVPPLLPKLAVISEAWLAQKTTREKRFSLGWFQSAYLAHFPMAVIRRGGRLLAFANLWQGGENYEVSADLIRYLPEAPEGLLDYFYVQMMLWAQAQGCQWFNLGMAPLPDMETQSPNRVWEQFGSMVYHYGDPYYHFQGLRQYKEKYNPVWDSKYLVSPGGLILPRVLANVTTLIAGGLRGVIAQ